MKQFQTCVKFSVGFKMIAYHSLYDEDTFHFNLVSVFNQEILRQCTIFDLRLILLHDPSFCFYI